MNELSSRAQEYLAKCNRLLTTTNRDEIVESFQLNEAPLFEPLIEFQQKYSGYQFMVGLEPVYFTLLHGDGGYPRTSIAATVEFWESEEKDSTKYYFGCVQTGCQLGCYIDEQGRYYEDGNLIASNFGKIIEHMALWDEIKNKGDFEVLMRGEKLSIPSLDKKLNLTIIPEASDAYTLWFKNDTMYMSQHNGHTTIVTTENFENVWKSLGNI